MIRFSNRALATVLLGGLLAASLAVPALAQQRDPAYQAARDAGQVGEKADGFLGVVGNQSSAIEAMVNDINNRRRANYVQRAQAARPPVTLEEYALTQGCIQIANTAPGEKYQAPNGSWQTRGDGPPLRDSRCP